MAKPEKLGIWDRIFNRYRKEIYSKGNETWNGYFQGYKIPNSEYNRHYVEYKIIDRVTGSERIEKEYFN